MPTIPPDLPLRYLRFANIEAQGHSPIYEAIARGMAQDDAVMAFVMSLPVEKRQPNLVLASVAHLFGIATDWPSFRARLMANQEAVRATILRHATQTNEAARCATLLPVLAQIEGPLALIEVGASAGLCLLPDYYGYDYGSRRLEPVSSASEPPVFSCLASEDTPLPIAMPDIVWRAGLDLNPLDAADPADASWLQSLVWPKQSQRRDHLAKALAIAAAVRPRIVRGDLLGPALAELCAQAPADATWVVFHTAVLAYVNKDERRAFADRIADLCDVWISNEAAAVFPHIASRAGPPAQGKFLLSKNNAPMAWTDPHGASIDWIAPSAPSA